MGIIEQFLADPDAGEDDEEAADEEEEPLTDEETKAKRRAAVEAKLMAMFRHPELKERRRDDR